MHGRKLLHDLSTVDKLLEAIFGVHIESSTIGDLQEKRFDPIRGPLAEIAQAVVVSRGPLSTPLETAWLPALPRFSGVGTQLRPFGGGTGRSRPCT